MLGIGLILNNNDYNNNNKIIFLTYILAPSCPDRIIIFEFEFSNLIFWSQSSDLYFRF